MSTNYVEIKTALISVTDKSGLTDFVKELREINPNITFIASGGTAKALEKQGINYTALSDYTKFPECFGGRVKTLHPAVAGGILMRRGQDEAEAKPLGIQPIDLVICNLYDFEKAAQDQDAAIGQLIESMDIGGSTLIRSATKNHAYVTLVVDPADYPVVLEELRNNQGKISLQTRERLALKGIHLSANYESLLAREFSSRLTGEEIDQPKLIQGRKLRYGENPDQAAWVYHFDQQEGIAQAKVVSGKELSYNNYEDATAAYHAALELHKIGTKHGAAVVKHGSLCGYATAKNLPDAFRHAWDGDSKSAFGSVIALTSKVDDEMIEALKGKFVEVIISPDYSETFVSWAKEHKPNLRLLQVPLNVESTDLYKNISGGMLRQTRKGSLFATSWNELFQSAGEGKAGVVTKHQPSQELQGLYAFGVAAVYFAKSNAIAIARETAPGCYQLIGMGAGQPNRVDSLNRLAIPKAIDNLKEEHAENEDYNPNDDLAKCVIASDGFFPFDDSIRTAAKYGFQHCIQPGGSKRDQEVIDAADELGMSMVFTGKRYFSH